LFLKLYDIEIYCNKTYYTNGEAVTEKKLALHYSYPDKVTNGSGHMFNQILIPRWANSIVFCLRIEKYLMDPPAIFDSLTYFIAYGLCSQNKPASINFRRKTHNTYYLSILFPIARVV